MAEIGVVIDGKYEILREIGRGGMSIVYLAMDTRLNKQWAVKEIKKRGHGKNDEIVVNSLLAEANMMKSLDHPALPRIVDIIDDSITIYVVMDYIEGESLDKVLRAEGIQSEEDVIIWSRQICDALAYLHSQKPPIIYRDMKPANVMIKPDGNIKIIDFGIAREYKEQSLSDTTILGTKGYAPPEQYTGQTDARSDIFALGMTMYHLLTGIDPRKGETYVPVRMKNSSISEGMELIVHKCVEPAAENRYQNCRELSYDLEHPELITKGYKRSLKIKLISFILLIVVSVLLVIIGFFSHKASVSIKKNTYSELVASSSATSIEDKLARYREAISIYPHKTEAFYLMLEAYEDEGKFGKEENDEFLALFNLHKEKFDYSDLKTAELLYKIGLMYFNYYTEKDGSFSFATRVQKSFSFFEQNHENAFISEEFSNKYISDCYYRIGIFYKKYILNTSTVEEASKKDYEQLFDTIEEVLKDTGKLSPYDQLSIYNAVFMLIYDQRVGMQQVEVDQKRVMDILERVYKGAETLSVQKEQSQKLRKEIVNNYKSYRDAVTRAYLNGQER